MKTNDLSSETLKEILKLFIPLIDLSFSCQHPEDIDYHEYVACEKCPACIARFTLEKMYMEGKIPKDFLICH